MVELAQVQQAIGREVVDPAGVSLGQVSSGENGHLFCRRGGFFRKTIAIRLEDVASIEEKVVRLSRPATTYLGPPLRLGPSTKPGT